MPPDLSECTIKRVHCSEGQVSDIPELHLCHVKTINPSEGRRRHALVDVTVPGRLDLAGEFFAIKQNT